MKQPPDFWNALAPFHSDIENNYFDLPSLRHILHELHEPVLVVGAGQGLIVAERRSPDVRTLEGRAPRAAQWVQAPPAKEARC